MKKFFSSLKELFSSPQETVPDEQEYVELNIDSGSSKAKVIVRPFILQEYDDIKEVLNCLREGRTVVLLNINPLKEKDIVELKRAISKLKKTTEAVNGEVAGFGDDYIIATPQNVSIFRSSAMPKVDE